MADFLCFKSSSSDRPEAMLNVIAAAIKHLFNALSWQPLSNDIHVLIKALVKSDTNRPACRTKVMPTENFAKLFESWDINQNLSLKYLRLKCITLLALTCMARPSDLAPTKGFSRHQIEFNEDGSATIRFFGIKNDTDMRGFEVRLNRSSHAKLDPVSCLHTYLTRTSSFITEGGPVFVSLDKPFTALTVASISNVLREAIALAGLPPTFTPRSFRASGATAAIYNKADPSFCRQIGRWKTDSVFWQHYVYPVSADNVTDKILAQPQS